MHLGKVLTLILAVFCQTAAAQTLNILNIREDEGGAICGSRSPQIEVQVNGVHAEGILTVELYKPSSRDFLKKASRLKRIRVPAEDGSQTVCFNVDAAGSYALAAYHDINGDRELDRQWNMLPAEPFALSNNQKLKLRMPKFEEAAFKAGEQTTVVRLDLRK
ncbi:conserved hypothetical protein [Hyphomonas neptunium ATCC 15444]|uniref:DUF2141 domain-containing protein n=2 Tax=Hyphomonas TaxID=85 RepID=Q0C1U8_HYPNA|nr:MULTISPECIES: DUF2141 domain-containing protein [Hyphomonas]ABI78213.1 conserved hypothetical protein [Hyphomonas neptunium ATCC 15444]KCZ92620.1 hypothetical protein HHI_11591 [Hyphomonas hirschiana VP5]